MMPLTLASVGEENIIRKVGGNPEVKKHLEDLGFVAGGPVTVISAPAFAFDTFVVTVPCSVAETVI